MKRLISLFAVVMMAFTSAKAGETQPIASIGQTAYYDVQSFAQNATSKQGKELITLLADFDLGNDGMEAIVISGSDITLDLNGHTMKGRFIIPAGRKLTIVDNGEEKTGTLLTADDYNLLRVTGTLVVNGGTFIGGTPVDVQTGGTAILNAGKYVTKGEAAIAIAEENATVNLGNDLVYRGLTVADIDDIDQTISYSGSVVDPTTTALLKMGETIYYAGEEFYLDFYDLEEDVDIKLLSDCNLQNLFIPSLTFDGINATIDLNGYTLAGSIYILPGTLVTINDNGTTQQGAIISSEGEPAINAMDGSVVLNGGRYMVVRDEEEGSEEPTPCISRSSSGFVTLGEKAIFRTDDGDDILDILTDIHCDGTVVTDESLQKPVVATVNGTSYYSQGQFLLAIASMQEKANAVLQTDIDFMDGGLFNVDITATDLTIDLNGHDVNVWFTICESGKLTIDDSKGEGAIITNEFNKLLVVEGTLIINGGTFVGAEAIYVDGGQVTLNGGDFEALGDVCLDIDSGSIKLGDKCVYRAKGHSDLTSITESVTYSGSVIDTSKPTAITRGTVTPARAQKVISNGRLIIMNDGKMHDLAGRKM